MAYCGVWGFFVIVVFKEKMETGLLGQRELSLNLGSLNRSDSLSKSQYIWGSASLKNGDHACCPATQP